MPKPVKKTKRPAAKRPSSDPMIHARQLMAEHMEKAETSQKPWEAPPMPDLPARAVPSFDEQYRAHMAKLGAKGGKISGARPR